MNPVHSRSVFKWPEFQAFINRLGVVTDHRTISLRITLDVDSMAQIDQQYLGLDNATETETVPSIGQDESRTKA